MPIFLNHRRNLLYFILIALVGACVYLNTLHDPFIFDDQDFITHNLAIHHLSDLSSINHFYSYRFLGNLTFALNYALVGENVEGYHIVNILIHIICSLLVWWLTCLIFSTHRFSKASFTVEKEKLALWVALLFLVHPVQTTAVDQVVQRYVLLAAMFYLLSVCLYIKARLSFNRSRWLFLGAVCIGLMGAFTRQNVLSLPLAILLCEIFFFNDWKVWSKQFGKSYLIILPFFLIAGAILCLYKFDINHVVFNAQYLSQSHKGETVTWLNYFLTQSRVVMIYLRILFFPTDLNFDYDIVLSQSLCEPKVIAGFLVIILMLIYAWRMRSRQAVLSFGIFWFFLTLSVESTIIPIAYVIAEYRLYLPLFGFCLGFVLVAQTLVKNSKVFTVLMGILVLACSILTIQRNEIYKSEIALWQDTVKKSPYKARPYVNLGSAYIHQGQYQKSLIYLNKALELGAHDYKLYYNLAVAYDFSGDKDKAIQAYHKVLSIERTPMAYNNLGVIYESKGDIKKAEKEFLKANASSNGFVEIKLNLARAYWHEGRIQDAIELYLKTLYQYPFENRARYALAQLYLQANEESKAQEMVQKILKSSGNLPSGLLETGNAFANQGKLDLALLLFNKALEIDPTYAPGYLQAGKIMANWHKYDEAIALWQEGEKYAPYNDDFQRSISKIVHIKVQP